MICLPFITFAQNGVKSFDEDFNWEKASETKTIYVDVEKGAKKVDINFEGEISQGSLHLTAYDPEGNKVAGFTLISSGAENSSWVTEEGESRSTPNSKVHVKTSEGSGSNSNSSIHIDSDSDSGSGSSVTVTSSKGETKVKSKSKNKNKNKNKDGKGYSVSTSSSDSKGAKGLMRKMISDPAPGQYKFVLEVVDVTGTLSAEIDQD